MRDWRTAAKLGGLLALAWPLAAQQSIPVVRLECPSSAEPKQQPRLALVLASQHSSPIAGRLALAFTSSAAAPADDPAVQFSAGGRTAIVSLAAGDTRAELAFQSGTVAGTIRVTATLESGGVDVTPSPTPACSVALPARLPAITEVQVEPTATGFNVYVTGYSTPRQVTEARYRFVPKAGYQWAPIEVIIPAETLGPRFTDWYRSGTSAQFGSQFTLLQPFTADQNMHSIGSVYVSLRNQEGLSQEYSASFP